MKLFRPTEEHRYFTAGKTFGVAASSAGKLGTMICFELRFPEIACTLREKEMEILLVPAQWGRPRKKQLEILARARAVEGQAFVLVGNATGRTGDIEYAGSSAIYGPLGEILAFVDDEEGLIEADIDLNDVYEARSAINMYT